MKYLHLKFSDAKMIREHSDKNGLGYNRFFHPINKMHVYNSLCVLMDRTPKPQLRKTDDKYMPLYDDLLDAVSGGYIKIKLIMEEEIITTIKKNWNANLQSASQYTWKDCKYVTGTLFPLFTHQVSKVINKSENEVTKMAFEDVMETIQSRGTKNHLDEFEYTDENTISLIKWCSLNRCTAISNYIENKQISSKPSQFGKRVNRGIADSSTYAGVICIPMSEELIEELIQHTRGKSTILDGGLVKIVDYSEIYEDDLFGFTKISELNSVKKFNNTIVKRIDWSDTIYNNIDLADLKNSIDKIIKDLDIDVSKSQTEYDIMWKNVNKISPSELKISKVAFKLNFFIEKAINKKYK